MVSHNPLFVKSKFSSIDPELQKLKAEAVTILYSSSLNSLSYPH